MQTSKIRACHLARDAWLYVRQSSPRQVMENKKSARRQYGLRDRAAELGWHREQIRTVDCDQAESGKSDVERRGFREMVAEVGTGKVGIVLALEVSRLSRNNIDWARLLHICAATDTLVMDEDGIYDLRDFNDQLLIGLKAVMASAELHYINLRMQGGRTSKARRGELRTLLPVGFVYDPAGRVTVDPDSQVRDAISLLFSIYERTGSAHAVAREFASESLSFPARPISGPSRGRIVWRPLAPWQVLRVLKNPRYAGTYFYGRTTARRNGQGRNAIVAREREEWTACIPGAHPGYITVEQFERNCSTLEKHRTLRAREKGEPTPPREGPALLQGIAVCGRCGRRMQVRYGPHGKAHDTVSFSGTYTCVRSASRSVRAVCQTVNGPAVDAAVGDLLVETVSPQAIRVAGQVQAELLARAEETRNLHDAQLKRLREEANRARRRFMDASPGRSHVLEALEDDWNEKLQSLRAAERRLREDDAARQRRSDTAILDLAESVPAEFEALWSNPHVSWRERKRMLRFVIEDVTLIREDDDIAVNIRFRGGACESRRIARPRPMWEQIRTPEAVVGEINRLLDDNCASDIPDILNRQGIVTGTGKPFDTRAVRNVIFRQKLEGRRERLRKLGFRSAREMARDHGVSKWTILRMRDEGRLESRRLNRRDTLYRVPSDDGGKAGLRAENPATTATEYDDNMGRYTS